MLNKIVQRIDPKICFMTYGHSHHSTFIEACHNHDITVVDVQYCALTPNYWPYHYPGDRQRRVKPDYIFLWGEYWTNAVELPYDKSNIQITGFPYFDRKLKKYDNVNKEQKVIFISNPRVGKDLSKFAAKLADTSLQMEIIYKLHGTEFDTWVSNYPELSKKANQGKVTVIDEEEGSLHRLLAESQAQVGITSTALYEGLGFNLPTYILNTPHSHEMDPVISDGQAELVDNAEDLASELNSINISSAENTSLEENYFFEQNSSQSIRNFLSQIL